MIFSSTVSFCDYGGNVRKICFCERAREKGADIPTDELNRRVVKRKKTHIHIFQQTLIHSHARTMATAIETHTHKQKSATKH